MQILPTPSRQLLPSPCDLSLKDKTKQETKSTVAVPICHLTSASQEMPQVLRDLTKCTGSLVMCSLSAMNYLNFFPLFNFEVLPNNIPLNLADLRQHVSWPQLCLFYSLLTTNLVGDVESVLLSDTEWGGRQTLGSELRRDKTGL